MTAGPALYPFQRDGLDAVMGQMEPGRSVMLTLATGGGKTEMAAAMMAEKPLSRCLFLAPRRTVMNQAAARFRRYGLQTRAMAAGNWPKGSKSKFEWPEGIQVVCSTYDTAWNRLSNGSFQVPTWHMEKLGADFLIFDEAHHAYDSSNNSTIARAARAAEMRVLGLTATCWRLNEYESFHMTWDCLVQRETLPELVEHGYLSPLKVEEPEGGEKIITGRKGSDGDFTPRDLERINRDNPIFTERLVDWWHERAGPDAKSMMYAVSQGHALNLANLAAAKPGARVGLMLSDEKYLGGAHSGVLAGGSRTGHRKVTDDEILQALRDGRLNLVVSVGKALEGVDVAPLDFVVNGRATASRALMLQAYGRAARKYDGKSEGVVLDATDNVERLGHPMQHCEWDLRARKVRRAEGDAVTRLCRGEDGETCEADIPISVHECPECGALQRATCIKCGVPRTWFQLGGGEICNRCAADGAPSEPAAPPPAPPALSSAPADDLQSRSDPWGALPECPACGGLLTSGRPVHGDFCWWNRAWWQRSGRLVPRPAHCGCDCECWRDYAYRDPEWADCCGCSVDGVACGCNGGPAEAMARYVSGGRTTYGWIPWKATECLPPSAVEIMRKKYAPSYGEAP